MKIKNLYAETGSINVLLGSMESSSYAHTAAFALNVGEGGGNDYEVASNPYAHFEATDGLSGLSDGDPISTWEDQSSNNRDLTQTSTARPTYRENVDGFPAIEFDGSDDYFSLPTSINGIEMTLVWCGKFRPQSSYRGVFSGGKAATVDYGAVDTFAMHTGTDYAVMVTAGGNRTISGFSPQYGTQFVGAWRLSVIDSIAIITLIGCGQIKTPTYSSGGNLTFTDLGVMCRYESGLTPGQFQRGYLRGFAYWERALSDDELRGTVEYFRKKYNSW